MPIMAAQSRSDARGNAQLLASMALASINDPAVAGQHSTELSNAYRLLEAYRTDASFGLEAPAEQAPNSLARLSLRRPIERHVGDVRSAIERALVAAFATLAREDAIKTVESVLRAVAYPQSVQSAPSQQDRDRAIAFFEQLVHQLQNS